MEADWSVAMGPDDPVIVVPWVDEGAGPRFVDLRAGLEHVDEITEALTNHPLRAALLHLNRSGSQLWTAKCDAWTTSVADGDDPYDAYEMDAAPEDTAFGAGSYIDLLAGEDLWFASFEQAQSWMRGVVLALRVVPARAARVEWILRPAQVEGHAGFGHTCLVEGCGATAHAAQEHWAKALRLTIAVLLPASGPDPQGNDTMARTGE